MKELSADALNKPRKRRLRKKLRVGEFQEFGFQVEFDLGSDTHMPFDDALDEWIALLNPRNGPSEVVEILKVGKLRVLLQRLAEEP